MPFGIFFLLAYILGAQKNFLIQMVLLSTHNKYMFWLWNNFFFYFTHS